MTETLSFKSLNTGGCFPVSNYRTAPQAAEANSGAVLLGAEHRSRYPACEPTRADAAEVVGGCFQRYAALATRGSTFRTPLPARSRPTVAWRLGRCRQRRPVTRSLAGLPDAFTAPYKRWALHAGGRSIRLRWPSTLAVLGHQRFRSSRNVLRTFIASSPRASPRMHSRTRKLTPPHRGCAFMRFDCACAFLAFVLSPHGSAPCPATRRQPSLAAAQSVPFEPKTAALLAAGQAVPLERGHALRLGRGCWLDHAVRRHRAHRGGSRRPATPPLKANWSSPGTAARIAG